jgi:hypothetical protein
MHHHHNPSDLNEVTSFHFNYDHSISLPLALKLPIIAHTQETNCLHLTNSTEAKSNSVEQIYDCDRSTSTAIGYEVDNKGSEP